MTERLFSLPLTKVGIHFGHVRMCATPCPISLIIFFGFGTKLYRQVVGIPMGTNCAPLVADLFLYCYERDFMDSLYHDNQADVIEAFIEVYTFRNLLGLLESAIMLQTSTLEINV